MKVTSTKIPSWTEMNERELLAELSEQTPDGGLILEIGCLYGGTTAVLALSNPKAHVISIDNFSWTPPKYPQVSLALTEKNLKEAGVKNSMLVQADSREIAKLWESSIDLLWIDGGHSYEYVFSDLVNFAPYAQVVALHDYGNPAWKSIKQAVDDFLRSHEDFYLDKVVGMIVVLRRK